MALLATVEVARSLAAIEALQSDWTELERRTPEATGFQSYDWCHAWVEALQGEDKKRIIPYVVLVRAEEGRVVWLIPLQLEKVGFFRYARALGQPVTQYADALAEPGPYRSAWWSVVEKELQREADLVAMIQIRVDSVLATTPGVKGIQSRGQKAPFVRLGDQIASHLDTKSSRSLRRRNRRLAEFGPTEYSRAIGKDGASFVVNQALRFKELWILHRGISTRRFNQPITKRFYLILASKMLIDVHYLQLGCRLAAIDFGIFARDSYRSLMSSYDLQFASGAPGHFLTRCLIEHYTKRGSASVDLLPPVEMYKENLCNESVDILSLHTSFTLAGRFAILVLSQLRETLFLFDQGRFKLATMVVRLAKKRPSS